MRALAVALILLSASWARAQIFCIEDNNGNPYHGSVIVQDYGVVNLAGTVDVDLMSWASERCGRWLKSIPIPEVWTLVVPTDGRSPTTIFELSSSADGIQILHMRSSPRPWERQTWHRLVPSRVLDSDGRPLNGATVLVTGTTFAEKTNRRGQIWGSSFLSDDDADLIVFHSGYDAVIQPAQWQPRLSEQVASIDIPLDFPRYGGILVDLELENGRTITPDDQLHSGYVIGQHGLYYVQVIDGTTQSIFDLAFRPLQEILRAPSPSDRLSLTLRLVRIQEHVHWAADRGNYPLISAKVGGLISIQSSDPKHPWISALRLRFVDWRLRVFTPWRMSVLGILTGGVALLWFPRKRWAKLFRRLRSVSTKPSPPPSLFPSA